MIVTEERDLFVNLINKLTLKKNFKVDQKMKK